MLPGLKAKHCLARDIPYIQIPNIAEDTEGFGTKSLIRALAARSRLPIRMVPDGLVQGGEEIAILHRSSGNEGGGKRETACLLITWG